ncbi:MAG: N-methyl-L-tryptophan oxidase [Steroidobacteraceae bacterium]
MAKSHDVIIAGLGAMGSAAAFHLAQRGMRVLGFDRFAPPHTLGSSHGKARIIREAYFEDPAYVPIVQRAYQLWGELEGAARTTLLLKTGGLMIGRPDSELIAGAALSAQQHALEHEVLSSEEVSRRFPCLTPAADMIAVYEPRAGILLPEACVRAHLVLAQLHGAQVHTYEPLLSWTADGTGVSVETQRATYNAGYLVICAGPWTRQLLGDLEPPLSVERQVQFWFDPTGGRASFSPARCPVHLWQFEDRQFIYGCPDLGEGVKVARHHGGVSGSPDHLNREADAAEIADMRSLLRRFLPSADGAFRSAAVCLYTNTPDGHFWIDRHPAHANVLIASPCCGHGFKFAAVVGEILADLATHRSGSFDLSLFKTRWPLRARAAG